MINKEKYFEDILTENKNSIYRICCYYISNQNDQRDLYQEVLINIWKALDKFEGRSKISTWIYRITVNSAISFIMKEKKRLTSMTSFNPEYHVEASDESSVGISEEQLKSKLLMKEISELPILERTIISLYIESVNQKEIARITGLSEVNVRVKISRLKHRLKLKIKEKMTAS